MSSKSTDLLQLARILLLGTVALPIFGVLYGIAVYLFLPLIVGPQFLGSADYVLWLGLAFTMQGVCFIFGSFITYSKKTYLITWRADFIGGILIIILCPILININGTIGAAQAVFLAFAISAIGYITASRKAYPMPWKKAAISLMSLKINKITN